MSEHLIGRALLERTLKNLVQRRLLASEFDVASPFHTSWDGILARSVHAPATAHEPCALTTSAGEKVKLTFYLLPSRSDIDPRHGANSVVTPARLKLVLKHDDLTATYSPKPPLVEGEIPIDTQMPANLFNRLEELLKSIGGQIRASRVQMADA